VKKGEKTFSAGKKRDVLSVGGNCFKKGFHQLEGKNTGKKEEGGGVVYGGIGHRKTNVGKNQVHPPKRGKKTVFLGRKAYVRRDFGFSSKFLTLLPKGVLRRWVRRPKLGGNSQLTKK